MKHLCAVVSAISLTSAVSGQPCAEPDANCQRPDQGAHGFAFVYGTASDANPDITNPDGREALDNFVIDGGGTIDSVCWWGFYVDFTMPGDCNAMALPDAFTVRYYENVQGFPPTPGKLKAGPFVQGVDLVVTVAASGNIIPSTPVGDVTEFEYTATHPPVVVAAGECCWVSIQNDSTGSSCWWLWSTAPGADEDPPGQGDANSYQFGATNPINDFDLAFCLDLTLGDPTGCKLEINPACEGASNPCDAPAGTPGCADEECCTLVCAQLVLCCIVMWDEACVEAASDICAVVPPLPEPCPPVSAANCQLPDLSGSGGVNDDEFIGALSDRALSAIVADNFAAGETTDITQVCWWGWYTDGSAAPDCSATATDDFTVTYYADDGNGLPVTPPLATFDTTSGLVVTRVTESFHTGNVANPDDDLIVYRYSGIHPSVGVSQDQCYWLEITNNLDGICVWFWETAPDNGTGTDDFDYSLQDNGEGYDFTDGQDLEMGWCLNIALGDVSVCAPPNPQESCDPAGSIVLTQNNDPDTITELNATTCRATLPDETILYTNDASFARSYDLGTIPETTGEDLEVVCVRVAVESNDGSAYPVTVNVYDDTDGGAPTSPGSDLSLLGSVQVYIPTNTYLGFVEARFDPPVSVPADTVMVVELDLPNRNPAPDDGDPPSVLDSGGMWPGTNNLGESADSYIRSVTCEAPSYLTMASIGAAHSQLVQEVHVDTLSPPCPWDCQTTPDGEVNVADFL
ncbi:MAG: DUF7901 domain-containing protein, partial [Planctomycetota bacterium]